MTDENIAMDERIQDLEEIETGVWTRAGYRIRRGERWGERTIPSYDMLRKGRFIYHVYLCDKYLAHCSSVMQAAQVIDDHINLYRAQS
jgi:hypothetical protein